MTTETRQLVRYMLLKLDPLWRRLPAPEQLEHKQEFGEAIHSFHARLLLRSYSLAGTRGDADLLLWQVADQLEILQTLQTVLFSTRLGGYLTIAYSYLGMTRRSVYQFPPVQPRDEPHIVIQPQASRYLFLYPFVKTREWYALSLAQRQAMMDKHVQIGQRRPEVRLNTVYSFGLDDQEFIVAFESDDPAGFLDLVMELRESETSRYTLRDTPTFTCIQMSIWDALDSLGGAPAEPELRAAGGRADGFTEVASLDELPAGTGKRVYLGSDAIALFQVNGRVYAVSDRCTHARASLSEGHVEPGSCVLECPWHGGRFDLETGQPVAAPVRVPIKTYRVKVEGERILVS